MMMNWMKLEPDRALPMLLALMVIYGLASFAAARSFAELAPTPFAVSGSPAGGAAQHALGERGVIER